ncbi:MAG TPA: hypothetical protein PKA58_37770, partial [Polyangium sp.]|nr:hypothetical protein [Polyangium sp.]
ELDRLAAKVGRDDRLAEVLVTVASVVPGPLKIELLTHASTIFVDRLGDRGRAIEIGRSILALHEEHPDLVIAPARTLEKLLALEARSGERCDVLERLAELEKESDPTARRLDLLEAARLASADLEDKPRAINDYRATLADQPRDVEALTGLAADLEFERRFAELAEALEQRAALTEGDSARSDLVRVAVLCDQELGDVARAVTVWEHVRSRFGADDESCDALAVLLTKASRWTDLVTLYEASAKIADEAGTTARAADLYRRLGDAQRDRTAQWLEAVASYESAIRLGDVGGKAALGGLETLLSLIELDDAERRPVLSSAVRVLATTYAASGDWQSTIALLEQRLAASNSVDERTSILTETASLYEHRQGDQALAFGAIWRAFAEAKTAELAAEILRLAQAADRWSDVAESFPGVEAEGGVPGLVARDIWWNLALWHRDRRDDERSAELAIERALGYDATNREMLTALVEIRRHAPGRSLVDALLRLSDVSDEPLPLHREAVVTAID